MRKTRGIGDHVEVNNELPDDAHEQNRTNLGTVANHNSGPSVNEGEPSSTCVGAVRAGLRNDRLNALNSLWCSTPKYLRVRGPYDGGIEHGDETFRVTFLRCTQKRLHDVPRFCDVCDWSERTAANPRSRTAG